MTAVVLTTGSQAAGTNQAATDAVIKVCDVLAADVEDDGRPADVPGIALDKIDVATATAACEAAATIAIDTPRMAYNLGRVLVAAGNYIDANVQLQAAASAKYPAAYRVIGDMYANGQGFAADPAKASEFYDKAIAAGDTAATLIKIETLQNSGSAADKQQAATMLRAAADRGNPHAQFLVAIELEDKSGDLIWGKDADLKLAEGYLVSAAAANWPGAQRELILLRLQGRPFDHQAAMQDLTDRANAGEAWAMTELAEQVVNSEAAEFADMTATQQFDLQNEWLAKAAALDDPDALYMLGTNLYVGLGSAPEDRDKAEDLFKRAADLGNPHAASRLGFIVYRRANTDAEYKEAARLFQLALDGGEEDGALGLGHLYSTGMGLPLDIPKAVDNYEIALKEGLNGVAGYELARIYDAHPDYKDPVQAAGYLIEAIDQVDGPEAEATAGFKEFSKATRVALQKELISRGLLSGSADGSFGPASLAAYLKTADWRS